VEHLAIDLGGRESQICIRSSEGEVLLEHRLQTALVKRCLKGQSSEPGGAGDMHGGVSGGRCCSRCRARGACGLLVVSAPAPPTALPAARSFFRRRSRMTRVYRSPKTPATWAWATKPGSEKSARIDLGAFTGAACPRSCTTSKHQLNAGQQLQTLASCITPPSDDPLDHAKSQNSRRGPPSSSFSP